MPLQEYLAEKKRQNLKIGLVPTMGALHNGHLSLVKSAKSRCDLTVVSIYVNPTQFNNPSDYENYPSTKEEDLELLENLMVDAVFIPDDHEMYPSPPAVNISFGEMASKLEGEFRPGHFSGVGIVVSKLFHIVNPDEAYFGQKDLQQVTLIKRLVEDVFFNVEVVTVPTERDVDGLALSSRNLRLTNGQRKVSSSLYQTLLITQQELLSGKSVEESRATATQYLQQFEEIDLEYLEVVDSVNLSSVINTADHEQISICIAAYLGEVRLIDNLFLISR